MKNLTMKAEYAFRFIHPSYRRKLRRMYQRLSLTKKVAWKRTLEKMKERNHKAFPEIYGKDGNIDVFAVAQRAELKSRSRSKFGSHG